MSALLLVVAAGTAYGQTKRYGDPRRTQSQYDADWRQPAGPFDRQPDYDYDGEQGPDVDVGFFYDELSPYGEWVRHHQYGWAWFPRHVNAQWRPYSLGSWVQSDHGWTWVSDEPFGWATYHYGRWTWDSEVGWLWVPGTDWGPAWVAWQQGNGYVGWAPLPPSVGFETGVGIRLGNFNLSLGIAPRDYAFVEERRFLNTRIGSYIVPEARNVTIIHDTRNITNYTVLNDRVINHGVPIQRVEQATGRRARRLRVATAPSPRGGGLHHDVISIYRPTRTKLETVRVARRNNAGLPHAVPLPNRSEALPSTARPPYAIEPSRQGTGPHPIPVAPRARPTPQDHNERRFLRENQDLRVSLDKDRRALEQGHRRETAKAQPSTREGVTKRQAAELQAQRDQRQRAEQQLRIRQQIQRRAAEAGAPKDQKSPKPAAEQGQPKKEKKGDNPKPARSF